MDFWAFGSPNLRIVSDQFLPKIDVNIFWDRSSWGFRKKLPEELGAKMIFMRNTGRKSQMDSSFWLFALNIYCYDFICRSSLVNFPMHQSCYLVSNFDPCPHHQNVSIPCTPDMLRFWELPEKRIWGSAVAVCPCCWHHTQHDKFCRAEDTHGFLICSPHAILHERLCHFVYYIHNLARYRWSDGCGSKAFKGLKMGSSPPRPGALTAAKRCGMWRLGAKGEGKNRKSGRICEV